MNQHRVGISECQPKYIKVSERWNKHLVSPELDLEDEEFTVDMNTQTLVFLEAVCYSSLESIRTKEQSWSKPAPGWKALLDAVRIINHG